MSYTSSSKGGLCMWNLLLLFFVLFSFFPTPLLPTKNNTLKDELPFVILICSYNNEKWVRKNLDSVFTQEYQNFRVIYLDDASTDNTANLVARYIKERNWYHKITLIKSDIRQRKLHNIYSAFHSCADHEIIVQLDGDDWFAHSHVLKKLNAIFHDPNVWFSYGQYQFYPGKKKGHCIKIPDEIKVNAEFRKFGWVTSHVKVFYGWLIKSVKLQDLMAEDVKGWNGKFYPAANDCATVFPMLDMAREKIHFNPKVMYIYNSSNNLCGHKVDSYVQKMSELEIRKLPIYEQVTQPISHKPCRNMLTDVLLLAEQNNPQLIETIISALQTNLKGLGTIVIFYNSSDRITIEQFKKIQKANSGVKCCNIKDRNCIQAMFTKLPNKYVIITKDNFYPEKPINIPTCIDNLEKTAAYGLFFSLSLKTFTRNNIAYQHIWDNIYAWKFKADKTHLFTVLNSDFSLYRKKDIMHYFLHQKINNPINFNEIAYTIDERKVGLFFETSSIKNL